MSWQCMNTDLAFAGLLIHPNSENEEGKSSMDPGNMEDTEIYDATKHTNIAVSSGSNPTLLRFHLFSFTNRP